MNRLLNVLFLPILIAGLIVFGGSVLGIIKEPISDAEVKHQADIIEASSLTAQAEVAHFAAHGSYQNKDDLQRSPHLKSLYKNDGIGKPVIDIEGDRMNVTYFVRLNKDHSLWIATYYYKGNIDDIYCWGFDDKCPTKFELVNGIVG